MNKMLLSTGLSWLWLALMILVLDFCSKQLIMTHFYLGESVQVIPFINFTYVHNMGAAFSFLADKGGWQRWMFSVIALIVSVVLVVMMYRSDKRTKLSNVSYAMIIGGALGNLLDRIVYGVVIDFIDFYVGWLHWPTFNVADASICIGAVGVMHGSFSRPIRKVGRKL